MNKIYRINLVHLVKSCKSCQLFDGELLRQTSNPNLKLSRLNYRFVISTYKRQVFASKFKVERAALTRLKIDLRKSSQTFSRW